MDLSKITDVQELKALKADQYDAREQARATIQQAETNIVALNERLQELESGKKKAS